MHPVDLLPSLRLQMAFPAGNGAWRLSFWDVVFSQRYDGWRLLGRGPWATVVRTRSRDLRHDIALKVFVNLDPELLERVRQEVRAVQALATPYLVHSYSLFDRGTIAWFEMELVEGLYRSRMNPSLGRNLADHIPDPGRHRTHFYAHYANRLRGERPGDEEPRHADEAELPTRRRCSPT